MKVDVDSASMRWSANSDDADNNYSNNMGINLKLNTLTTTLITQYGISDVHTVYGSKKKRRTMRSNCVVDPHLAPRSSSKAGRSAKGLYTVHLNYQYLIYVNVSSSIEISVRLPPVVILPASAVFTCKLTSETTSVIQVSEIFDNLSLLQQLEARFSPI